MVYRCSLFYFRFSLNLKIFSRYKVGWYYSGIPFLTYWMGKKIQKSDNTFNGRGYTETGMLSYSASGNAKLNSSSEGNFAKSNQTIHAFTLPPSNPTSGSLSWRYALNNSRIYMYKIIHYSILWKNIGYSLNVQS